MEWQALSSALLIASQMNLGNIEGRNQDRFDGNAADTRSLIHDKNSAHDPLLRNPTSRTLHERFFSMRATLQRELRWMENNWLARKSAQIQSYANINDAKNFYEAPNGAYGPNIFSLHPVRSTYGVRIKNRELILAGWAEHLQNLLSKVHTTDPGFLYDLSTLPIIQELDDPQSFEEAISLKDNKAVGPDNIPAEVIEYCGCVLHRRLHEFILDCWPAKCLPQQCKNANIILTRAKE